MTGEGGTGAPPEQLPVSVIIITRNEADRLPRALASVAWAAQVVVVDSGSTDGTAERARRAGAEVVEHAWEGYSAQKAFALTRTRHDWVFWLDADEAVSPPLLASIRRALERERVGPDGCSAYAMNRRTRYLGRYLRHGGWYPDRKVRLFRRDRAEFDGRRVHEGLRVTGEIGFLEGDLLHDSFRDLDHHVEKTHEMARLWAEQEHGRQVSWLQMMAHPIAKGLKSYILKGGFLEGWRGVLLAGMGSYSVWLKYALLRAQQGQREERSADAGSGSDAGEA